ncbi:MAG TPA: hypothetical protein VJ249_09455 [Candidatus Bathyarchaeia archaeon]|nr:hypothetical protein [Candidatus Bathyarchaeia archaeon]
MQIQTVDAGWTTPISDEVWVRLYADTRPRHHLITNLQKGLILVSNRKELVGEGIGLGVPAVRYRNRTYFSGSSSVKFEQTRTHATAIKKFTLDLISERILRSTHVETATYRRIGRSFAELYKKHKHLRLLMIENLLRHIGVKTDFVHTTPAGTATMTYRIARSRIKIKAEFELPHQSGLQKIYLLNEQGSKHFRKYSDSTGTVLFDKAIGAWEIVNADWACVHSVEDKVGFRLWKLEEATLYKGREFLDGIFDWVGLDYEANPGTTCFEYDIELVRR